MSKLWLFISVACLVVLSALPFGCTKAVKTKQNLSVVRLHDLVTGDFFCSGTVVSSRVIITAAHCLAGHMPDAPYIAVVSSDGTVGAYATAAFFDERTDQGLIVGDFSAFKPLGVETSPQDIINSTKNSLVTCGYPYGGKLVCTTFEYLGTGNFMLIGNGFMWPGMSGGPIIDLHTGKVIGANYAVTQENVLVSTTTEIFAHFHVDINGEAN